jgi:hypothetical protein
VVRQKLSSVVRKPRQSQLSKQSSSSRSTSRLSRRSAQIFGGNSNKDSHGKLGWLWRIFSFLAITIVIIVVVAYIGLQKILSQADELEAQTVILAPRALEGAPPEVWVINLEKSNAESSIISIDSDAEANLPGGYGKYRVGALYPLMQIEGKDEQYIRASYSRSIGMVVDAVIPINSFDAKSSVMRRLVFASAWKLLWQPDKEALSVLKTWVFLLEDKLPTKVQSIAELQTQLARQTTHHQVVQECPVGILNGSETAGAAGALSKMLEASKVVTIRVGTFPEAIPVTKIYHDGRKECRAVLEKVSTLLLQKPAIEENKEMTTQYRSSIVLVLGDNL